MSLVPLDDRDGFIWFDGKVLPWREAKIHVLAHSLHYGSAVFEGAKAYEGRVFKLHEHSERLHRSAGMLGYEIPYSVEEVDNAVNEVIARNKIRNGYIRPIAWRGSEVIGVSAAGTRPHLAIAAFEWPPYYSPEARLRGIRLKRSRWTRPGPQSAPTASKAAGLYMICTLSRDEANAAGYDDALMLDFRGQIAEGTAANFFCVIDNQLHTPTPDCFLDGITRRTVMDLARKQNIPVVERAIFPDELSRMSEIFLTGTAVEVIPVNEIEGQKFTVGSITRTLIKAYEDAVQMA